MRRGLLVLVGAVIFVDTMLYAALEPLLPSLSHRFGLDKGQAGVLVGLYALGTVLGAAPGGLIAARRGPRAAVLAGLALMTIAGTTFALASSIAVLDASRFVQGLGGACSWTACLAWLVQETPRERRGEVLGIGIGAGIFGAQLGPALGALAAAVGRGPAFGGAVALGVVIAAWTVLTPERAGSVVRGAPPAVLLADAPARAAFWLTLLPSIAFGVIAVLVPLRLSVLGAGATAIGAIFFLAAFCEALVSPVVGRIADRRGTRAIVRGATLVATLGIATIALPQSSVLVAVLLAVTAAALGALWVPGGSLLSERADALNVDQGWAFALNTVGWGGGVAIGSGAGGALAQLGGDGLPYGLTAALCVATLALTASRRPGCSLRSPA